jgi:hypothetical protein
MKTVKLKDNEIRLLIDAIVMWEESLYSGETFDYEPEEHGYSKKDMKDAKELQQMLKDIMQSSQVKTLGEAIEANNNEFKRTKDARIKEMQKEYAQKSVNWRK